MTSRRVDGGRRGKKPKTKKKKQKKSAAIEDVVVDDDHDANFSDLTALRYGGATMRSMLKSVGISQSLS